MYTFSFPFHPWKKDYKYAAGQEIMEYMKETMETFGIDKHVQYSCNILSAAWSDDDGFWTLRMTKDYAKSGADDINNTTTTTTTSSGDGEDNNVTEIRAQFLILGTGYYDYRDPHWPHWAGEKERFTGTVMHPQFWDPTLDCRGKNVVVCGSGATAITIVPALAAADGSGAKHVTMIQRSPTFMINLPPRGAVVNFFMRFKGLVPWFYLAHALRLALICVSALSYWFTRAFPAKAKAGLIGAIAKQLGKENRHLMPHFEVQYNAWDQRICVMPDGDFVEAVKSGRATIVTDEIDYFEERGVRLKRSGALIECDVFIPATGLRLQSRGGIRMSINGIDVAPSDAYMYRGSMCVDAPNLFVIMGYFTSSWTLRASLIAEYAARMVAHCRAHEYRVVVPRARSKADAVPIHEMSSGYLKRGEDQLPKQGKQWPYRMESNWLWDLLLIGVAPMNDSDRLEFRKAV